MSFIPGFAQSNERGGSLLETLVSITLILTVVLPLVTATLYFFQSNRYTELHYAHREAVSSIGLAELRYFNQGILLDSIYVKSGLAVNIHSVLHTRYVTFHVAVRSDDGNRPVYELKLLRSVYE